MSVRSAPPWTPSLGAWVDQGGTTFRVWAPDSTRVEVIAENDGVCRRHLLARAPDGTFSATVPGLRSGDFYRYQLDNACTLPDPASRYQPYGVHGPSQIVDAAGFRWSDQAWSGIDLADVIFYELHVGTFSPEGTFEGVTARLPQLAELGITAIELMPVGDFPGMRNWGYDGAAIFAPARCYGTPDDLRRLVDAAHGFGIAIVLDVVYNHLGPDGAYLFAFSPHYVSDRHHTPWGAGLNFDGDHGAMVRDFFIENALHWVHEYHVDGLRLDATHAIADDSRRHFLAELTTRVRQWVDRKVLVIAEDDRNLNWMLKSERDGGWGVDAVWADAFHHHLRRLLAGDSEGYYRDYSGRLDDLVATIRRGWFYTGQFSTHRGAPRGTDPRGIPADRFVICLQNHDQIGNRALGGRLHHEIDLAAYRAASVLLLVAPETPLLFMGQEWAAGSPFLYFTDHHAELGRLVTAGRRQEFRHFAAFHDPASRDRIPDPQALATFLASRLNWAERALEPHLSTLRLYRALLRLRRCEPAFRDPLRFDIAAVDDSTIVIRRGHPPVEFLIAVRLVGAGTAELGRRGLAVVDSEPSAPDVRWTTVLTSEDAAFSPEPAPPRAAFSDDALLVHFLRPSAIILRRDSEHRQPLADDLPTSVAVVQ